ncbi:unnamed protein product, partial [Nesidiocoris tenuis]
MKTCFRTHGQSRPFFHWGHSVQLCLHFNDQLTYELTIPIDRLRPSIRYDLDDRSRATLMIPD